MKFTLHIAASNEQSASPRSIIADVIYAMDSIPYADKDILANFSCRQMTFICQYRTIYDE